jgi:hypothetical protein
VRANTKQNNCNTNWQMNTGGAEMSDMTREEAIKKARENYMNCYWDQQTVLSNLYNECEELEEGDLDEYNFGNC